MLGSFYSNGQIERPFICGTAHVEELKQEMLTNREIFKGVIHQRSAVNYSPIKVHLVTDNEGNGAAPMLNVLKMLCSLNKAYADQNFQFYFKDIVTLKNSTINDAPQSPGGSLQMSLNKDTRAINIFITSKINKEGVAGYYLGPPGSSNDFIVIEKSYIADVRVAPHEVGHYLTLPHTFHGWESAPWDPNIHGNPVTAKLAPDGFTINELADSSNCGAKNVGDGFCDTPADYNFGASSCTFTLEVKDQKGNLLKPQTNNFMNYFFGCANYIFTNNQKEAISNSYASNNRRDIRGTQPANMTAISSPAKLLFPVGGVGTLTADSVVLDWEDMPGATNYLVQYDVVPTFELFVVTNIVKESKLTIRKLTNLRTYHWRVIPYNEYSTCYADPAKSSFKAGGGTATPDIPEVKSFLVAPNPLGGNKVLRITLETKTSFTGSLSITDISGKKIVYQAKEFFQSGGTYKAIDLATAPAGVYFVSLSSAKGVSTRKLILY